MYGLKFGRLTVVSRAHTNGHIYWNCLCDCGNMAAVASNKLRGGRTISCGCARKTHGRSGRDKVYRVWLSLRERCNNPRCKSYANYGGRGITVCAEWDSFEQFVLDMGPRPEGYTIERIDNNGGYSAGNCRWATAHEQMQNTRNIRKITFMGVTRHLSAWAWHFQVSLSTLWMWCAKYGDQVALQRALDRYGARHG